MAIENPIFNPIQCTSEQFPGLNKNDGDLYFLTDTKQLYLAKNGKGLEMCGGVNIIYGKKAIVHENTGQPLNPEETFSLIDLEGEEKPLLNDLILNSDGCFYKVTSFSGDNINTTRLTLQGTGGGGSSDGGSSLGANFSIAPGSIKKFATSAENMYITIDTKNTGTIENNNISYVALTVKGEDFPFYESRKSHPLGEPIPIDLAPYASLFNTITNTEIILDIQDDYYNPRSTSYYIKLIELSLTYPEGKSNIFYSDTDSYSYDCDVNGGVEELSNRRIIYSFYKEDNPYRPIYTETYKTSIDGNVKYDLDLKSIPHGTYILTVQAIGDIPGSVDSASTELLRHKFIRFNENVGTPLFSAYVPEKVEQFATTTISALLVTGSAAKTYTANVKIDGEVENTLYIVSGTPLNYNHVFDEQGIYSLELMITELNLSYRKNEVEVTAYTGYLPVIDTNNNDLVLYLTPKGKSNSSVTRSIWENFDKKFSATLSEEKFYFGDINGWQTDDNGINYLKVSQGAEVRLDDFYPFASDAMDKSRYGITIELDFQLKSILNYNEDLIRCISTDKDGVIRCGFRITGNKAYLYTGIKNGVVGTPITLNLVENERIKLSFVIERNNVDFPMILTYLNGIISNVSNYASDDHFVDAKGDGATPATLYINSQYGEIDIYGIRIYSAALQQFTILGNYQASLGTLTERQEAYDSNKILTNNKVDLRHLENPEYNLEIPYIKLTGGYKAADKKDMVMGVSGDTFALPVGKKDYRLISFELKYPKTGYFSEKGYQDFSEICTFASGKAETSSNPAYGETPLTGAVMYAQGTSSLEYPVKNLRIKFKTNKVSVRPGMEPVDLICLKADFMESSGSHNTGAANYIDDVYKMANMKTPGQKYYSDEDIVTSIKGHPVAVFWSPSGVEGTYEYIGKYNFNLDKATPEPFGFKNTPEAYDPNAKEQFGWDANGNNTIRCFEYLDNSVRVCNFLPKEGKTYEETWYELITDNTGKTHYGWTEGFESRHPEDLKGEHHADCLYTMASWVNELYNLSLTDRDQALARFKNEYECYFDKDYLIGYYLISSVLLMIDSRTKNCMMASWGPEEKSYYPLVQSADGTWEPDETQEPVIKNNYIWYPIFYDMDTMLGIDNQGFPRLNYYDEDTNSEIFNGNDVLWNFVRDALPGEVVDGYRNFESKSSMFTASTILPYFNNNQADLANEALYNGDAEYKYIDTFRNGYYDHLNTDENGNPLWIAPGTGSRLYAAQGNRSLDRQYFITNRINFLRGKYESGNYVDGDRIEFRCYNPSPEHRPTLEGKEKTAKSIEAIPFSDEFTLKSLGPGFSGIRIGQKGPVTNRQFNEANQIITFSPDQDPDDTESYILGLNNLSDIGDLSNKYLSTFTVKYPNKLRRIVLGNEHKDYYNPYWKEKTGSIVDVQACSLLEELNMYNCSDYQEQLNLSNCKQLQKILLTGSGVNALTLPEGTVINELRLPDTIPTLTIKNQNFLTPDKFSFGHYDYAENETLMINGQFVNTYNNLEYVEIINTNINSYEIATKSPKLQEYIFTNVNWVADTNDEQYCSVYQEDFNPVIQYYKYNNGSYTPYSASIYEQGLYEKITLINEDKTITRIPVLERLMRVGTRNGVARADSLTGVLTINLLCDDGSKPSVNQFDIYNRYNKIFPNLTLQYGSNVTGVQAHRIEFYRTDIDSMTNDVTPDYVVLTDGLKSLATLTGNNSPAGEPLFAPSKAETNTNRYEFSGYWVVYAPDDMTIHKTKYSVADFETIVPSRDLKLAPEFTELPREYTIKFYDHTRLEDNVTAVSDYSYNQIISTNPKTPTFLYREFTDQDKLGVSDQNAWPHMRWGFKGWIYEKDAINNTQNPTLVDLATTHVLQNMSLYPYYEQEDARIVSSKLDFFDFNYETVTCGDVVLENQYIVSVKPEYAGKLKGLITIPSKDSKNKYIDGVGKLYGESSDQLITKIYFLPDAKITSIGGTTVNNQLGGLYGLFNLNYVYFDSSIETTLRYLGDSGFSYAGLSAKLVIENLPNSILGIGNSCFYMSGIALNKLPTNLSFIGTSAFETCKNITFENVPSGITIIPEKAFFDCTNLKMTEFGHSNQVLTGNENNIEIIKSGAFNGAGSNLPSNTIYLYKSLTAIETTGQHIPFRMYGGGPLTVSVEDVELYNSISNTPEAYFGPSQSVSISHITT